MWFFFWILCGVVGYMIGKGKGEGGKGAIISLLLGPIGWIIVALSSGNRVPCRYCMSKIDPAATVCPSCSKPQAEAPKSDTRKCPFCAEEIKTEAKVCRYCNRDIPPAQ